MSSIFKNAKVLVAGGTGLIGIELVKLLVEQGAKVRIASLDKPQRAHPDAEFLRVDLRDLCNCIKATEGNDYVFNLMGVKGSPAVTTTRPASFFVPIVMCNTNLAEAARLAQVKWYLYTSSVGVYAQAPIFIEDEMWKSPPSENDKFPGWAKRIGEMQLEAYGVEYKTRNFSIVRPANVYGPNDNFNPTNAMVIPSLVRRVVEGENPLVVWGDGSQIRDFIHCHDVARVMLFCVENKISEAVNAGSGTGISIRDLVNIIVKNVDKKPEVQWDTSKPAGDKIRLMDINRITSRGFKHKVSFEEGIRGVVEWYRENKNQLDAGYNAFHDTLQVKAS